MKKSSNNIKPQKSNFVNKFLHKHAVWLIITFFSIIYSFVAVTKHNHFQTGLDFGIYVQTFWNYIHFKIPRVTFYPTYGDIVWTDHFTPSLVLLAPFYLIWEDPSILLILQSVLFVFGGYPIYLLAKDRLKNIFLALAIVFAYLIFLGTQFALTFDFHAATYTAIFLPWIFYFLFKSRWRPFLFLMIIAMGAKEDIPLLLASVAFYLFITKKNTKMGLFLLFLNLTYFFLVTKMIMPGLSIFSAKVFDTPEFPHTLVEWFGLLFDSPVKIRTMLLTLGSFAFLPLLSGWFLIVAVTHFFINFFSHQFTGRWDIFLHYRVHLGSILSFGAILGIERIINIKLLQKKKKILSLSFVLIIIMASLSLDWLLHLPLNTLFKKQFYTYDLWMHDNEEVIKKIPKEAYLLTQNNLAPHVANRKNLYYYPKNLDKADFIFLDLHKNQPIINTWLGGTVDSLQREVAQLLGRKTFAVYYQKGDAILLQRVKK